MSRHRGAKPPRRYGLLGEISLLSPEYLLSDERRPFHIGIRRITRTCFRACSTYQSRSQAPFYPYALRTIANRAEGTFVLLRYLLGGDRPSQTAHLALFPASGFTDDRLDANITRVVFHQDGSTRTGVPDSQPPTYATHDYAKHPILGCSKGSRGLSVLPRVRGIFTTTSISPSPSLRQCPSRYAIRAGRNLPDKEFRYLRTVIVTAALHRGFGSSFSRGITTPLNLPAAGRRQSVYGVFRT
jgi:hypothetical protein